MSLKFLNLKGWHPSNKTNQKLIWIAEQKAADSKKREKEANEEIRRQNEVVKYRQLAAAGGSKTALETLKNQESESLRWFMYQPPPGLKKKEDEENESDQQPLETKGEQEDDAVAEFRRKISEKQQKASSSTDSSKKSNFNQRNLERYVGRRPDENVTIRDQVERFPFLKDAPVEGEYTDSMKVNFKPMGVAIRNVKCIRCGEWGHQSGDRECHLKDFNPHDAARLEREDPISYINKVNETKKQSLILKKASLPLEMQGQGTSAYDIVASDDSSDPEKEFLATLSTKEKKLLLKRLKSTDSKDKKSKKHKKEKRKLKKSSSRSSRHHTKDDDEKIKKKKSRKRSRSRDDDDRKRRRR